MRRNDRQLSREEAEDILRRGEYGILCTCGTDGEPYGTPLSYVYCGGVIYFHCAPNTGHKLANIGDNPQVCFTVVGRTCLLPEKFSTLYESAVAFGCVYMAQGSEKRAALHGLLDKYAPQFPEEGAAYIARAFDKVGVYAIRLTRLTAKARRE